MPVAVKASKKWRRTVTPIPVFIRWIIEWGDPEAPGLRVTNTQHIYHETRCECGHLTREEPGSQPRDDLLPGVALSEWRLVGPGLSALIVCLAYRMRLSRQRIVEFLSDWFGIQLSVGIVHNTIMESGRATMGAGGAAGE